MIFHDMNASLSHNPKILMLLGARNRGKSYGAKDIVKRRFDKKGHQFSYVRRKETEIDLTADTYFDDISIDQEWGKIEHSGGKFLLNDKLMGYSHAVSKANDYKSASYPSVQTMIFEEFVIDPTEGGRYLKNEFSQFLNLAFTVFRHRPGMQIIMLANYVSIVNPYTSGFDLFPDSDFGIWKKTFQGITVMLEIVPSDEDFKEHLMQSDMGKLLAMTKQTSYNIDNVAKIDRYYFIATKTNNSKHRFSFTYNSRKYGVWQDELTGLWYVSYNYDPSNKIVYSTTITDFEPNMQLLKGPRKSLMHRLFDLFRFERVRFESIDIQYIFEFLYEKL